MAKRTIISNFRDAVDADHHTMQLGENGFPEYTDRGLGSNLLLINQLVRGGDPTTPTNEILTGKSVQDIVDLIVLLFATRNTRGGKGEKDLSFKMFLRVWKELPQTTENLLPLFAHFGYWKDFLLLMSFAKADPHAAGLAVAAMATMREQLVKDIAALDAYKAKVAEATDEVELDELRRKGPSLSLLAKWLPRERSKFDKELDFVNRFTALVWPNTQDGDSMWQSDRKARYRRTVAELASYFELPEVLLSLNRGDEINFHKVASKATFRLTKAFLNENKSGTQRSDDPKRIRLAKMFIEHLVSKGVKGGQVMPHELVHKILYSGQISRSEELVLDAQWKDMVKTVVDQVKTKAESDGLDFNPTQMVPLSDVSGSMHGTPMEVSIALGILISEITHPAFRDMVLTFETRPKWHRLVPTDTIVQKVRSLKNAPWGGSTNFLAAHKLILDVAVIHRPAWEDLPSLIIFSDMQFDSANGLYTSGGGRATAMQDVQSVIEQEFAKTASTLGWTETKPKPTVFWNLRNTGSHPTQADTEGAVLLAGFSPSLLKLVMNGEAMTEQEVEVIDKDGTVRTEKIRLTPAQILRQMLDDSLYDPVRVVLASSNEGILREYKPALNPEAMEVDDFAVISAP